LSGRQRTNDCFKTTGQYFRNCKTMKIEKMLTPPQDGIENNAPQRVQTTVSPPRGDRHRRRSNLSTTHLIITINTKLTSQAKYTLQTNIHTTNTSCHGATQCQTTKLSQDMMAETINQANHCFTISAQTQYTKKSGNNTEVILLPEMANAVICPETGKSLKHQELITKLRYKIKWMRSTANEIKTGFITRTQFDSYTGQISQKDEK
jgi:hypothetical protein